MRYYTVELPWPDGRLSRNARGHWRKGDKPRREARYGAATLTRKVIGRETGFSPIQRLVFEYHPPDRRRRDIQNIPHMLKSAIDGIADALKVDDNGFQPIFPATFGEVVKGGKIIVHISEVENSK